MGMLIKNDFEVAQPVDKVWTFLEDIPSVAACLPGTQLTNDLGNDNYAGKVVIRIGPVKLEFDGKAKIVERNDANKRIVVDASGADQKGRANAAMTLSATVIPTARGSRVDVGMDLQLAGAAAQYGRGMVGDVTAVLMRDFASNMQTRLEAIDKGLDPNQLAGAAPASGFGIFINATKMALARVIARFFRPYRPTLS